MTATVLTPRYAEHIGGSPDLALREVRHIIEHQIVNQPRSLQRRIGPSEIGTPCDHCLAAKLAGWTRTDNGIPWLPYVGTAVHAALSDAIIRHENQRGAQHNGGLRYLSEHTVTIGNLGDQPLTGSCDLFDIVTGTVIDYKIVGATTLTKARTKGPTETYKVQGHCYGQGWVNAGFTVNHVAIYFLPRNDVTLNNAVTWTAPFDPTIPEQALERTNRIHTTLQALEAVSTDARDAWITEQARNPDCMDCSRYPDAPTSTEGFGLLAGLPTTNNTKNRKTP